MTGSTKSHFVSRCSFVLTFWSSFCAVCVYGSCLFCSFSSSLTCFFYRCHVFVSDHFYCVWTFCLSCAYRGAALRYGVDCGRRIAVPWVLRMVHVTLLTRSKKEGKLHTKPRFSTDRASRWQQKRGSTEEVETSVAG